MIVSFRDQAIELRRLTIAHPAASGQGGYGPHGEVIYTKHPTGCPSVLVDSQGSAKATFMSNGSVEFRVRSDDGLEVEVLRGHFDPVEKREIGMPSQDLWLRLEGEAGTQPSIASLINPQRNFNLEPAAIKLVKLNKPSPAFWFTAEFASTSAIRLETAVAFSLVLTDSGPALLRRSLVRNAGKQNVAGQLWSFFNLMGTQRFVYNKSAWYDRGLPLNPDELVVAATVPFSNSPQVKRLSTRASANLKAGEATCDAFRFVGDCAATSLLPAAVRQGKLLPLPGDPAAFNRFSSPTITAVRRNFRLAPGEDVVLEEALLYVTAPETLGLFRNEMRSDGTSYHAVSNAFKTAARNLLSRSADVAACVSRISSPTEIVSESSPEFQIAIPAEPAAACYLNSVWAGVSELYENCRAHGARLADGIELGTRDRAQDMWPMLKADPGRVRADLLHALSFLYRTVNEPIPVAVRPLTRREKLHGMFPRQYPERWLDRTAPVRNDNRPYNDSAIWTVDALLRYLRETGDTSILNETVPTVRLTAPDTPETSALVGHDEKLPVWKVLFEIFDCYRRQATDNPYGMIQAMFGDWADPVDMFGTRHLGDNTTRGDGRGVLVRLSCHVFCTLTETIEVFRALIENSSARSSRREESHSQKSAIGHRPSAIDVARFEPELPALQKFAIDLRDAILRFAWESDGQFVDAIHELKADGTVPAYARGETGYTLGSRRAEREFDGTPRTVLTPCAWGLALLQTTASWLLPLRERDAMIRALLANVDRHCFSKTNGLNLYAPPIANTDRACRLVGRLGMLPPGCAENGEYHHAQVMMHFFRFGVPGQADTAWAQFKPVLSSARGPELCGPFDQTSNSYACDPDDPHCGAGMNFGLSGSMDWMFELLESVAGLKLALQDPMRPDLRIEPNLPVSFRGQYSLRRILHKANGRGGFVAVPLNVTIAPVTAGEAVGAKLNGQPVARVEVADIAAHQRLDFCIRTAG